MLLWNQSNWNITLSSAEIWVFSLLLWLCICPCIRAFIVSWLNFYDLSAHLCCTKSRACTCFCVCPVLINAARLEGMLSVRERCEPSVQCCLLLWVWLSSHLGSWNGLKHGGNKTALLTLVCVRLHLHEKESQKVAREEVGEKKRGGGEGKVRQRGRDTWGDTETEGWWERKRDRKREEYKEIEGEHAAADF